jgi:hypothetical protein
MPDATHDPAVLPEMWMTAKTFIRRMGRQAGRQAGRQTVRQAAGRLVNASGSVACAFSKSKVFALIMAVRLRKRRRRRMISRNNLTFQNWAQEQAGVFCLVMRL